MIAVWVVTLEALSLAVWPLVRRALPGAVDGGWAASRVIGPMLLALVVGAAAMLHLLPYTPVVLVGVSAAGASLVWLTCRPKTGWRRPSRAALVGEAVFLGTFGVALGLRVLFPSADNNERPMDFAFLSAFVRTDALPPVDPWFAGKPIAYYTFGYLGWANVTRLAGVAVEFAYNLAVASVFAMAVALAWATAASVRGRLAEGFLAAGVLALLGNLRTLVDWLIVVGLGTADWWASWATAKAIALPDPGWALWMQASRVVPNTSPGPEGITEFPFFSLVVGDLHPHYMAMPANILAVALALGALRGSRLVLLVPLAAATLAGLAAGNTWNVPAAAVLIGVCSVARFWWPRRRPIRAVSALAALLILTTLMAAPLLIGLTSGPVSLGLTPAPARLWPGTFAVLFLPYALAVAAVLVAHARPWRGWPLVISAWTVVCLVAEVLLEAGVAMLLIGAILGLTLVALRTIAAGENVNAGLLATCAIALGLVLAPELVFLSDYFGTRMNTVFKFYFQALLFLAVALPPLLANLPRPALGKVRVGSIGVLRKAAVYAGLLTLLYVPLAPFTRMGVSPAGGSLDALAFLQTRAPGDLAAIDWLRSVAPRDSVVLEAADAHEPVGTARWVTTRISAFSGIPTLLGWVEHEQQWRGRIPEIDQRLRQVDQVYQGGSLDEATQILRTYGVNYVVVGPTERARYGPTVNTRFDGWLEPAFQSGDTSVFSVPDLVQVRATRTAY
jgi:YYY domain-containing protein